LAEPCLQVLLLYLLFVNDLIVKLRECDAGIRFDDSTLSSLFFADDIVLLADSAAELKRLLAVCAKYASHHRFDFSVEKSTSSCSGPPHTATPRGCGLSAV